MAISKAVRALLKALSYTEPEVKKNYESMRTILNVTSPRSIKTFDRSWDFSIPNGDHTVPVRVFSPVDGLGLPVLLFFHGGGWVTGNIDSYDRICAEMARETGRVVVSVDYRLAPEHPFPAALEDCYTVTKQVLHNAQSLLRCAPEEVVLIGDSAGGNLAAAVSLMMRDRGDFIPCRQILLYPATASDHHPETSPFDSVRECGTDYLLTSKRVCDYLELYASCEDDWTNPYFAPLLAENFADQPDTLVITAQMDPLRDEGEAYGERLREGGADVEIRRIPNALHGFIALPGRFSTVRHAYRIINQFLRRTDPKKK